MEYFIWFCLCYTLYRSYVLLGVLGRVVRDRVSDRIPEGWAYIENSKQEEDYPVVKGFDAVPDRLPEVPCVDGEAW